MCSEIHNGRYNILIGRLRTGFMVSNSVVQGLGIKEDHSRICGKSDDMYM